MRFGDASRAERVLAALVHAAAEAVWPTRCVGCGREGALLCEDCRKGLAWVDQRWSCPSCGAPYGWLSCTECKHDWPLDSCTCAFSFEGAPKRMVTAFKDGHETRLAPVIGAALACAVDEALSWRGEPEAADAFDAVAFVPATPAAYRRRGFDHMLLVSHALGSFLGLPVADVLARVSERDQRALGREERAENLSGSVMCIDDVAGMRILLADDVVTTGASMCECARSLLARGAASVGGCALCRVW